MPAHPQDTLQSAAEFAPILRARGHIYYGGKWQPVQTGREMPINSPATGAFLGAVADAGPEDVDRAVAAAREAFPAWRDLPARERSELLRQAAVILREHVEELALIDALDSGNPLPAMRTDVRLSAEYFDYFAGLVLELKGSTLPLGPGVLNYTMKEPFGVVARIAAFNHPTLFVCGRVAAPLAAGNCVVVKPAEQTPLSAIRVAELIGGLFPAGVLNYVTGGRETGAALVSHPSVAKIALIGSINAGRAVMRAASDTLKSLTLELGGKNALVACADADPSQVAHAMVRGMNFTSVAGQSCGSTSRAFVHEDILDDVLSVLPQSLSAIRVGLPTDPDATMGSLSSEMQYRKTLEYIEIAKSEGARLVFGGRALTDGPLAGGFYIEPTVFADVTDDMRIAREEVFGPVLSILSWRDEADVIRRVNALDVGLTAAVWTNDIDRAHRMAARIEAGYVWINDVSTHEIGMPFGGYKQSGFGKEEAFEEMLGYTREKNIHLKYRA